MKKKGFCRLVFPLSVLFSWFAVVLHRYWKENKRDLLKFGWTNYAAGNQAVSKEKYSKLTEFAGFYSAEWSMVIYLI